DGHDAVEGPIHVAVVGQREGRLRHETLVFRPPARDGDLLARKRDARDLSVADPREVERETAPAAADVENALAGLDEQLGGYVALLGELALVQRLVRRLE